MVGAIVLAAGASTRMGSQKLLLPFAGSTVVEHIAGRIRASGVDAVHIVVGHDADRVSRLLAGSAIVVVENPEYAEGMLSSVRAGLRSAGSEWSGALVVLGDQPLIEPAHVEPLLERHAEAPLRIVVPTFEGKRGHPLLVPRDLWGEVLTRYDAVGLRGLLREYASRVEEVLLRTPAVLQDMDYPEDYRAALAAWDART